MALQAGLSHLLQLLQLLQLSRCQRTVLANERLRLLAAR